jgi:hypothetical protein
MCRLRVALAVAGLIVGMGAAAQGANQIRNWEFDEPLAGDNWWLWETTDFERVEPVPDTTMSGDMSLRVVIPDGAAGSLQLIQSYLELVQGQTYYIASWPAPMRRKYFGDVGSVERPTTGPSSGAPSTSS